LLRSGDALVVVVMVAMTDIAGKFITFTYGLSNYRCDVATTRTNAIESLIWVILLK